MAVAVAEIETTDEALAALDDMELAWLPVDSLTTERKYQRELNRPHVQYLVDNWDPFSVGCLYVAAQGSRNNVMDGQHRVEAAKLRAKQGDATAVELPCLVYRNCPRHEQARLFVAFNRKRRIAHTVDVFRASCAQGDETALAVRDIIAGAGHEIGLGGNNTKFQGVGTAIHIYERFGGSVLAAILNTMRRAWKQDPRGAQDTVVIRAVAAMYSYYSASHIDWDIMQRSLSRTTREDIIRAANGRKLRSTGHQRTPSLAAMVISELYNESCGGNRRARLALPSSVRVFTSALRGYRHDDIDSHGFVNMGRGQG